MNKKSNKLNSLQLLLEKAWCTEKYYMHWIYKYFIYTDGIKLFAEKGEAYWLIDHIALFIARNLQDNLYFINIFVKNSKAYIKAYRYTSRKPDYKIIIPYTDLLETKIPYKFKMNIYRNANGIRQCILCLPNED